MMADLDMESVFGDLDKVSTKSLQSLRTRLKEYIDTQKDLQPDSLKDLVRAIDSIDKTGKERKPSNRMPRLRWMQRGTQSRRLWLKLRTPCITVWAR